MISRPRAAVPEPDSVPAVLDELRSIADPSRLGGMARVGIATGRALGVSIPSLRKVASAIGVDHRLAGGLYGTGVHEARILASMIDDPERVTEGQMERWVRAFDSWDLCDQVCANLFDRTPFAYGTAFAWSEREPEFVRRAGFVLMAGLAFRDRSRSERDIAAFLPVIEAHATDERNYVKKAVNWALREVGKRSRGLNRKAAASAKRIARLDSSAARWVARDALRELTSDAVRARLRG